MTVNIEAGMYGVRKWSPEMTLDEIEKLLADATQGPWQVDYPDELTPNIWVIAPTNCGVSKIEICDYDDGNGPILTDEDYANARLIAAAPALARLALDQARELAVERKSRARYQDKCEGMAEQAEADQIKIEAQAAEIARLRGVLEHGLKECARETIRAEAAEAEIARLRDALRNSAAILQAACNSKRLHEGDSFRIGGVYLQTIGDTLDQSNKALAALEPKP